MDKWLKNKQSLLRVSYYMVGYQHGDPWLCPDRESLECLLHVSQLLLPPTTSSRMVLASGVTAMSLSAESQHCDSPGNLRRTQYLLELTCFVYRLLILPLARTHTPTAITLYFFTQPHRHSMNTVMLPLIRAGGDTNLVLVDSRRHIVRSGFAKQKDTHYTEKLF